MNFIDIIIIVLLASFAIVGFKRGVLSSLVMFVGTILVIVLSYTFKNFIGDILVLNLPFISFGKFLGGAVTLNVILYQTIAFILTSVVFTLLYKFIVSITGIVEKILRMTIILGIPSKLLGLVVGFLEGYIIVYIALFILSQPFVNLNILKDSNYASHIVNETPILSSYMEDSLVVFKEIEDVVKLEDSDEINLQITDLILKHHVTSPSVMQQLVDKKKIEVEGISKIIDKYREEKVSD